MKQIEEGCLAIVVNSVAGNNGTCVTVGKYLGRVEGFAGRTQWEVDVQIRYVQTANGVPIGEGTAHHCPEANLLRIDSYDGETEEETAQEEVAL